MLIGVDCQERSTGKGFPLCGAYVRTQPLHSDNSQVLSSKTPHLSFFSKRHAGNLLKYRAVVKGVDLHEERNRKILLLLFAPP